MNDSTRSSPPAPAMLRQEGPHKVTVAPGGHSALSPQVGLGTKRLRPAVGAVPIPGAVLPDLPAATLRGGRVGEGTSVTEVRRLPGPRVPQGRWAAGVPDSDASERAAQADALAQRLSALAELNVRTAKGVTALEREAGLGLDSVASALPDESPNDASDPPKPTGLRRLFNRRSP